MVEIGKSLILGLIQGITEFLPVSSSGHLAILQRFFNFQPPLYYDVFLHTATMLATVLYFRKEIKEILSDLFNSDACKKAKGFKFIFFIIVSTLFTLVIAFPLKEKVEQAFLNIHIVKYSFLFTAIILFATKFIKENDKDIQAMSKKDAIFIGIAQGLAVIPGISRSGMTISAGLITGLRRNFVGVYSFLLSIVVIFLATLYELLKILKNTQDIMVLNTAVGFCMAFVAGYASLSLLIPIIKKGKIHYFSYYLFLLFIALLYFVK